MFYTLRDTYTHALPNKNHGTIKQVTNFIKTKLKNRIFHSEESHKYWMQAHWSLWIVNIMYAKLLIFSKPLQSFMFNFACIKYNSMANTVTNTIGYILCLDCSGYVTHDDLVYSNRVRVWFLPMQFVHLSVCVCVYYTVQPLNKRGPFMLALKRSRKWTSARGRQTKHKKYSSWKWVFTNCFCKSLVPLESNLNLNFDSSQSNPFGYINLHFKRIE